MSLYSLMVDGGSWCSRTSTSKESSFLSSWPFLSRVRVCRWTAVMDLSKQVYCAGMAYVALSRVKQMQKLHFIAFDVEAIKVSSKSLEELNRLRQTYRPDLPLYVVPPPEKKSVSQKRKQKMSGTVDKSLPSPKKQRRIRKRKTNVKSAQPPSTKVTASRQPQPQKQEAKVLPSKPTAGKRRKLDSAAEQLSKFMSVQGKTFPAN